MPLQIPSIADQERHNLLGLAISSHEAVAAVREGLDTLAVLVRPGTFDVDFPLLPDVRGAFLCLLAHGHNAQVTYRTRDTDRKVLADDFRRECSGQIRVSLLRNNGTHGLHVGVIPGLVPKAHQIVEVRKLQCLVVHRRIRFRRRRTLRCSLRLTSCLTCTILQALLTDKLLEILSAVTV